MAVNRDGQPYESVHENAARLVKASRLVDAFIAHATHVNGGVLPEAPVLAGMADVAKADRQLWLDLAEAHGVNPPSDKTIALAVSSLKIKAREAGGDPFAGLPS